MAACALFIGLAQPAAAQLPLEPAAPIAGIDGPNDVVLADLDRDGDLDALAASGPDGTGGAVTWWPFDAGTGWGAGQTIDASFSFAKEVVAADLDRDGDLDVAAVSFQDDQVAWWENTAGDGSAWSSRKLVATGVGGAVALAVADLDGDAHLDLLACARDDDAVLWFENDGSPGDGGWITRSVSAAAAAFAEATDLAVADIDRDGYLDVVAVARLGDEVAWWRSDGSPADGTGGDGNSWTFHSITTGLDAPRALALADFDRDGDDDLALATDDTLVLIARTGAGWATPETIGLLAGVRQLLARDLDHDGDADLLAAGVGDDRVVWWQNALVEAEAGFIEHEVAALLDGARGVTAGDVDRDGDLDLVAGAFLDDALEWWENRPIHRTVSFVEIEVAPDFADTTRAADLDGDGDLDLVAGGPPLVWYERQGTGSATVFVSHLIDAFAGLGGGVDGGAIADLDGDGDLDVAVATGFAARWWENDGTPLDDTGGGLGTSWTRHTVSDGHSQLQGLSVADLDRDGALDLLAFDLTGDEVLWWRSDGTPADDTGGDGNSWTEAVIDGVTDAPRSALARDIDRDGDLDVVVASQLAGVTVWRNDADAASWVQQTIGAGTPLAVAAVDLGSDGDLDVLAGAGTGAGAATVNRYDQLPPADGTQWAMSTQVGAVEPDEPFLFELTAADFDLDGDADAAGVGDVDRTYWWENPSLPGGWARFDVSIGQFGTRELVAQEASGDGLPDLLASSNAKVVLWENRAAQAELLASETDALRLEGGAETAVLRLNARTLGRSGDNEAEIARLDLLLEETPGVPLSGAQANAVLAALHLYEDIDSSGDFDAGADQLIGTLVSPSPVAGEVDFVLPDFAGTIGSASFRSYFLVVETTPDALAQSVASLRVTLRTSRSRMEDAVYDAPLTLQSPEDVASAVLALDEPFFADGFESGDLSAWAVSVP